MFNSGETVMKKKKEKEELPDYTVADMDLEGMPWNRRKPWSVSPSDRSGWEDIRSAEYGAGAGEERDGAEEPFSREETRGMIWGAMKAALLIGMIFVLAAFLFLLFCVFVWLR
ncbi:MAG: hypothetical protein PHR92_10855 [Lachnospiraceae bacterium]|nr:hypothetical protein [Lachnospiraceae bacterium]